MRDGLPGIFCLEGEWSDDLRQRLSVRPVLELLEHLEIAQWIHRDAATKDEFEYYLDKWTSDAYDEFGVLWLAMHGGDSTVALSELETGDVGLDELGDILKGSCAGKVIYFASCSTLKDSDQRLQQFAKKSGARAVIGYRKNVNWVDAAAFEVLLLQELVTKIKAPGIFKSLQNDHPVLAKRLGLVIATKTNVYKTPLKSARSSS